MFGKVEIRTPDQTEFFFLEKKWVLQTWAEDEDKLQTIPKKLL